MNTVSTTNNKYSNNDDIFNATKKLDPRHSFTAEWLILSLRENDETFGILHGNKAIKDVTSYDISIGKGFISIVLKCTVTFVNFSDDESYTTILKIPGFDSFIDAQNSVGNIEEIVTDEIKESFVTIHQSECDFYNKISKLIDAPIPKIFKTVDWILEKNQEGCIHMEDLTIRGKTFENYDRINIAQAKCFVRNLAKMHKNILTVDPEVWKGKYLKGQTTLAGHIEHQRLQFGRFLEEFKRKDQFKPYFDKYAKFMINPNYYLYIQTQSYKDLNLAPIIVHGDISGGNLMFSNVDENEIIAIIDWQLMHEGSPMEDLAKLLAHLCDGSTRRKIEEFIFEFYLKCLKKEFGNNTKIPYTLNSIKKSYNYCFITQTFFVVMGILQKKIEDGNDEIAKAFYDSEVLKCLHALEDADRILQGELKEFYEKYNY